VTAYYGDEPHQIVLYHGPQPTLTRVACTCSAELGLVPVRSGTRPALDLFHHHKETVINNAQPGIPT
jgi:hypothetical protein